MMVNLTLTSQSFTVWTCVYVCLKSLPGSLDLSFPVPLVPLTEANEDAMENKSFHRLLRKLGLRPPANEQVCVCVCVV